MLVVVVCVLEMWDGSKNGREGKGSEVNRIN